MKLAMLGGTNGHAPAVVLPEGVLDLVAAWSWLFPGDGGPPASAVDLIAREDLIPRLRQRLADARLGAMDAYLRPLDRTRLAPPVPIPGKLICAASNYPAHIVESGREAPPDRHVITPWLFLKPSTCIIGPGAPIPIPRGGQAIDWEVELAVVVGRRAKHIPPEQALAHVFGYTIVNDISERRFRAPEARPVREWDKFFDWLHGKWFDGFAPLGPWITTADEIPDPQALSLELRVNGQRRQHGNTAEMIYPVAELIAFASAVMTLEPGDIIATGTPQGVGSASGERLRSGDVVECRVEGIGTMVNPVTADEGATLGR